MLKKKTKATGQWTDEGGGWRHGGTVAFAQMEAGYL